LTQLRIILFMIAFCGRIVWNLDLIEQSRAFNRSRFDKIRETA
jgi:hypothetical protein